MSGTVIARFNRAGLVRPRARYLAFRGLFRHPNRLSPELLYEQVEPALRSPGFADALRKLVGYDLRDRAGEIEIPTLVLWGFNDRIVPVQAGLRSSSAPVTSPTWSAPPASTGCSTNSSRARPHREVRLNHVTLAVRDLDRSVAFYRSLGLGR